MRPSKKSGDGGGACYNIFEGIQGRQAGPIFCKLTYASFVGAAICDPQPTQKDPIPG